MLVDPTGHALYAADQETDGAVLCVDACTSIWRPLAAGAAMPSGTDGVGTLGVVARPDGTKQVTVAGRPLYTFTQEGPGAGHRQRLRGHVRRPELPLARRARGRHERRRHGRGLVRRLRLLTPAATPGRGAPRCIVRRMAGDSAPRRAPGPRGLGLREVRAMRRDPLAWFAGLRERYGGLAALRLGPVRYLGVNDPELIRQVLVDDARGYKKGLVLERTRAVLGEGLLTSEGELHRRHARIAAPAFGPRRVAGYHAAMRELADADVGGLARRAGARRQRRDDAPDAAHRRPHALRVRPRPRRGRPRRRAA